MVIFISDKMSIERQHIRQNKHQVDKYTYIQETQNKYSTINAQHHTYLSLQVEENKAQDF